MISFKVFDNNLINENQDLIKYINENKDIFLEYTFYNNDNKEIIKNRELFLEKESSFHLNSKKVNLIDFKLEEFLKELSMSRYLNAKKLIIHPEKSEAPKRLEYQTKHIEKMINSLKEISYFLESEILYIENVRFDLDFYRILFLRIKEEDIPNIGFCFDIGHSKTFSQYSFKDWFLFLEFLDLLSFDIYFHIHANEGEKDEHKPYHEYIDISILNDAFYTNDIISDLKLLFARFEDKWFSLELMPNQIIKEIDFLKKNKIYLPK